MPADSPSDEKDEVDMKPIMPGLSHRFSLASINPPWRHSSTTTLGSQGGQNPGAADTHPSSAAEASKKKRMIYSPVSPSWPVDLGGSDSLTDLQRAEGDLIIVSVWHMSDVNAIKEPLTNLGFRPNSA